ncbi:hypothetical protein pdam_00004306, partial [Pocillopora damicornis]
MSKGLKTRRELAAEMKLHSTRHVMDARVSHVNFEPKEFAYLNITRISSQLVRKDIECGFACLEITSCFSYNLAAFPDANGKLSCELLPSDKYNNSDKLIYSPIFNHFSIP